MFSGWVAVGRSVILHLIPGFFLFPLSFFSPSSLRRNTTGCVLGLMQEKERKGERKEKEGGTEGDLSSQSVRNQTCYRATQTRKEGDQGEKSAVCGSFSPFLPSLIRLFLSLSLLRKPKSERERGRGRREENSSLIILDDQRQGINIPFQT